MTERALTQQVVMVVGASSGVGRAVAEEAAARGAAVWLVARSEDALASVTRGIVAHGARAGYSVADVTNQYELEQAVEACMEAFGRVDTYVHVAGAQLYGWVEEIPLRDAHDLFETNYFGVVRSAKAALPALRESAGALIVVGSVLGERALPLVGHYGASKAALKGFVDALRMECMARRDPVAICLVKPAALNTPFLEHAAVHLDVEPRHAPPVYAPELAAKATLTCAVWPRREVYAGNLGKLLPWMEKLFPETTDRLMARYLVDAQLGEESLPKTRRGALTSATGGGAVRGKHRGRTLEGIGSGTGWALVGAAALAGAGLAWWRAR